MGSGVDDPDALLAGNGLVRSGAKLVAAEVGFSVGDVYVLYVDADVCLDGFCQSSPNRSSMVVGVLLVGRGITRLWVIERAETWQY